jgi:hypothetical protein
MNKQSNRIIVLEYRIERDHTEIDLDLLEKQFPGYSDDDKNYPQIVRKNNNKMSWSGECEVIEIGHVEKFIADAKAKGCTHMEVMHHSDHNGYYFYGVHVSSADKNGAKEINEEIKNKHDALLRKKKAELEAELKQVEAELGKK